MYTLPDIYNQVEVNKENVALSFWSCDNDTITNFCRVFQQ